MKHFSISEVVSHSWKLFKANAFLLVALTVLDWALSFIGKRLNIFGQSTHVPHDIALYAFTGIALAILSVLIHIGIFRIGLDLVDGKKAKPEELLSHTSLFWKFILVSIVSGCVLVISILIPTGIGLLLALALHQIAYIALGFLALIPITYFILTFGFAPVILVDKNTKIFEAFKKSAALSKDNRWSILGFIMVFIVINALGALLLGLGLLVSAPVTFLAYLLLYRKLA